MAGPSAPRTRENDAGAVWFLDEVDAAIRPGGLGRGPVAMVEREAPAGAMPPLHRRDEHEAYRVVQGSVTFYIGADVVSAGEGDVVVAPAGSALTFRVDSEHARWMVLTSVDSLARYEDFCRAVSEPLDDPLAGWPSPEEEAALASTARANGIELLGPPGLLPDHVG
jgi:quercetin dioxygenase-like cupin family protein